MARRPSKPGLMHDLGAFVGGIVRGVKASPGPAPAAPTVVAKRVIEAPVQTPAGPVILRRTVIDEVVAPPCEREPAPHPRQKPRA